MKIRLIVFIWRVLTKWLKAKVIFLRPRLGGAAEKGDRRTQSARCARQRYTDPVITRVYLADRHRVCDRDARRLVLYA